MDQADTKPTPPLTDANAELMEPIAALMKASEKDLPTKVGVLIDLAGAMLATSERLQMTSELRHIAEEMRKRLIQSTRLHQAAIEARQQNATVAIDSLSKGATKAPFRVVDGGFMPDKA